MTSAAPWTWTSAGHRNGSKFKKLNGTLTQSGNAGGNFDLTGAYEPRTKSAQLSASLSDFNQDGLRPFLEPLLAGKQLVSIAVNGNASVQYAPNSSSAVKADLQVTNLVVHDPQRAVSRDAAGRRVAN